jgi:hypothetical protein
LRSTSLESIFKLIWGSPRVKTRYHYNPMVFNDEIDGVWKTLQYCSAHIASNTRELVWRKRNSSELLFDSNAKLSAKSFTSILIPRYRVIKLTLCDPTKND